MDIEDETFEQYFGRPRNLRKYPDGPQNAQDSALITSPGNVPDIDNPELMYMQTADNFYKKNEAGSAKNEQIEEFKFATPLPDIDEDESPMVKKKTLSPNINIKRKETKLKDQSFLNKSKLMKENLKNAKTPNQKHKEKNTRENELERNYDILLHS